MLIAGGEITVKHSDTATIKIMAKDTKVGIVRISYPAAASPKPRIQNLGEGGQRVQKLITADIYCKDFSGMDETRLLD